MLETLLTTKEVAELLQCKPSYIRKPEMILALQGIKIGNKYRFKLKHVESYIQQQQILTRILCEELIEEKKAPKNTHRRKKRASKHNLW